MVSQAHAQTWDWSHGFGSPEADKSTAITVDPKTHEGYVCGYFVGAITLGTINLVSEGEEDVFLAKLTPSGQVVWAIRMGGKGKDLAEDLALLPNGHVVVVGQFEGAFKAGTTTLKAHAPQDDDVFVAALDPAGKPVWLKSFGGTGEDDARAIAADASGNIYIAGTYEERIGIGKDTLRSVDDSRDAFLVKLDSKGTVQWVKTGGGSDADALTSLELDPQGNILATGVFVGEAVFDGKAVQSKGLEDIWVVKYTAAGNLVWVNTYGGERTDWSSAIALDKQGYFYLTGYYRGICQFGSRSVASLGDDDMYLARFNPSGQCEWAKSVGGIGLSDGNALVTDGQNGVLVTGKFQKSVSFDDKTVTSSGQHDVYVARYSADGTIDWVVTSGGPSDDSSNGIACSPTSGSYWLVGHYEASTKFRDVHPAAGKSDAFIVRLNR